MNTQMLTSNLDIFCVVLTYATFVGAKLDPNELTEEEIGKLFNYRTRNFSSTLLIYIKNNSTFLLLNSRCWSEGTRGNFSLE